MTNSASASNSTRLLAAAAFQGTIRAWLVDWLRDPNRAVPPEVGVDLSLVARVAAFSESRERAYNWLFAGLAVAAVATLTLELVPGVLLIGLISAAAWFKKDADERSALLHEFSRQHYSPGVIDDRFTRPLSGPGEGAIGHDTANLTVYSGFTPFVGAGLDVGGWSFAVATDRGKQEFGGIDPAAFHVRDLYRSLSDAVSRLDIPGLEQRDHFFVQGSDVRNDDTILAERYGRPAQTLGSLLGDRYAHGNDSRVRHYRWIRVQDWNSDLVVSYFVRCSLRGTMLFVEVKQFLLTPLKDSIRKVDNLGPRRTAETMAAVLLLAPVLGLLKLLIAPFIVLGYVNRAWEELWGKSTRERRKLIDANLLYDYGAATSVRQAWASGEYVRYFQRADSDYYTKAIQKKLLDALVDFLDAKGIDTSDLRERQSTILNNGVIVQGGNVEAGSLAVGDGARAVQKRIVNAVKRSRGAERGVA